MLSMKPGLLVGLATILTFCAVASAQQPATAAAPAAPAPESRYAETTAFKTKIFEIKNGDPERFHNLLAGLGSGFKGAEVRVQPEFGTITVRDFPENLAVMEEALKRLDKPQPPRPSLELHIHILIASDSARPGSQEYPAEIADAIKQLQGTLKYKSYSLVASSVQRAKEGRVGINNRGTVVMMMDNSGAVVLGNPTGSNLQPVSAYYDFSMGPISLDPSPTGPPLIQIVDFRFHMSWSSLSSVGFNNPLTLRDGEKVVVGTTTIGSGAVVVVITGKVLG
jgi:hypothetical protein